MTNHITSRQITPEFTRTYKTQQSAEKAVQKFLLEMDGFLTAKKITLNYMIIPELKDGAIRYGVLFVGTSALEAECFRKWNVVA